jgi:transglutaminase-like putative cysteine protease
MRRAGHPALFLFVMRYLFILLCLLPAMLFAQPKNFSVTPAPSWLLPTHPDLTKTPDLREISDGFYLLLFEHQQNVELHSSYEHRIRQIVSEAGIQSGSEVSVTYDPVYEKVHFHQLIIRRNGQVINKLQPARFKFIQQEEELSRFIYSGTFKAFILLEDVRKGDQIEYSYTLEGTNPVFGNKFSQAYYLAYSEPIFNFYISVLTSPSRTLHMKAFSGAQLPAEKTVNGMKVYEWDLKEAKAVKGQTNAPTWHNSYPFVHLSEYNSWKEVIDWGCQLNAISPIGPALKSRIADLKKEAGDNKELYIRNAIRFVQDDIRYMGIEMGEYSHRPNSPDKVFSQRFGDCKDKSLLLATILNANDIPACMAYVNTYDKQKISDYLPAPDLFNHAIVYTTFNGRALWVDPTISYQRGNLHDLTIPEYGKGLIISPGRSGFENIHNVGKSSVKVTETFVLPGKEGVKGLLSVNTLFSGEEADNMRNTFATSSMKSQEEGFLNYYKKTYGNLKTDSALKVIDNDSSNEIRVLESYILERTWKPDSADNGRIKFHVYADLLRNGLPPADAGSSHDAPIAQRYPSNLDYDIILEIPGNWPADDPDVHIKNDYYKFDYKTNSVDGKVILHYHYETFSDHIPVSFIDQYNIDKEKIQDVLSFYYFWKGDHEEEDTTPAPPQSLNWLMIGFALLVAGFFSWQATVYYKKSQHPVKPMLQVKPLSDWLALLGIVLVIRLIQTVVQFISVGTFTNEYWRSLATLRSAVPNVSIIQLIASIEIVIEIGLIVANVLLLFLYFKRRDTFPITTIYTLLISVLYSLIVEGLNEFLFKQPTMNMATLIGSVIGSAIWTAYLIQSEQVKETFIMPHDSEIEK